jgi:hypothetical protein
MTTVTQHDHARAQRIAEAQAAHMAWEAERRTIYGVAANAAAAAARSAGVPAFSAERDHGAVAGRRALAEWEQANPEPRPPQL